MPPSRAILACLGAAALVAGCGGGEPDPVVDKDATLRLKLDEYRILPQAIRVRPGRIRLVALDVGRLTHNVVIQNVTDNPAQEVSYASTDTAHPGDTVSLTTRLRRGRYRLVCTISNHQNLGQYATLIVKK